jgi:hypothetical protein
MMSSALTVTKAMLPTLGKAGGAAGQVAASVGIGVITGIESNDKSSDPAYLAAQMEKALIATADYLVCQMQAIVSSAMSSAAQTMSDQQVNAFNSAVGSVIWNLQQSCSPWNCLNGTDLPPSQRDGFCVRGGPPDWPNPCATVTEWNAANTTYCTYQGAAGTCDPSNRLCYTYTTFGQAAEQLQTVVNQFYSEVHFGTIEQYTTPTAMAAYAQAATVYLSMQQQQVLLGPSTAGGYGYAQNISATAEKFANGLQVSRAFWSAACRAQGAALCLSAQAGGHGRCRHQIPVLAQAMVDANLDWDKMYNTL